MKYTMTSRMFGLALSRIISGSVRSPKIRGAILVEYKRILNNAKDIGEHNTLLSSYSLAAYFIALNRCDGRTAEENYRDLEAGMRKSRLLKLMMGSADGYFDPKRTEKRMQWAEETHKRLYENDWVVDVLPGNEEYDLGYDYWECGVCKLCKDEGCPELAKYLCRLDFLLVEIMGIKLTRTTTLAEGGEKCDFRFHKPQN